MKTIRPIKKLNKTTARMLNPKNFNYSGLKSPEIIGYSSIKKVSFRTRSVEPAPKEKRLQANLVNLVDNENNDLEIIAPGHKIVLDKLRNSDLIEHDLGHGVGTRKQYMERGTAQIEGIEEEDYRP